MNRKKVRQRFANGTQGRLLQWHPGATESTRKALPAYCPDLLARFCKETSLAKQEMLPDVGLRFLLNYIDLSPLPSERNNAFRPHGHRSTTGELGRTWRAHHAAVVRRSCIRFDDPQGKRLFLCAMEYGENKPGSRRKHCRSNTSSSAASRGSSPWARYILG